MISSYTQKPSTIQKIASSKAAFVLDSSSQGESLQRKAGLTDNAAQLEESPQPNNTGMSDNLKAGIESLSGFSMDDVRVHYNSSKPATVQALAYTQGTDIHVAPGQEKCLPHEAWHVAQQMAGRVSPTTNINGMPVNDIAALEHEADVMGERAVQCKNGTSSVLKQVYSTNASVQRYVKQGEYILSKEKNGMRNIAVKEDEASTIYIKKGNVIPDDLTKLGIENKGSENIIVNGRRESYQKLQQGRIIFKPIENESSERKNEVVKSQDLLSKDDKKKTEKLLKRQRTFVCELNKFCNKKKIKDDRKKIKKNLESLIREMREDECIKCLGADVVDAVFAMYYLVCKENFNESDKQALKIIKDDLALRQSQIENELSVSYLKPLVRTECAGSAVDRFMLMNGKDEYNCSVFETVCGCRNYVAADFKKENFNELGWSAHKASCIDQNLSDDSLYIEDAVGKSFAGKERANAHWFAHIYGVNELAVSANRSVGEVNNIPYPLGDFFSLDNRFNLIPENEKAQSIKDKMGKCWEVNYDKILKLNKNENVELNIHLLLMLDDHYNFIGSFDRFKVMVKGDVDDKNEAKYNSFFDTYHNYLVGIMDFMVQTANSAIDGTYVVGEMSEKGFSSFMTSLSEGDSLSSNVQKPNLFITRGVAPGDTNDMSLLSVYKANHPSQN